MNDNAIRQQRWHTSFVNIKGRPDVNAHVAIEDVTFVHDVAVSDVFLHKSSGTLRKCRQYVLSRERNNHCVS